MKQILNYKLKPSQAALWFLGQSGFICKSCNTILAIDPYLSDSVAKKSPALKRTIPVPIKPANLKVDIFILTHDHLDHLDPETIIPYKYKDTTKFVAPRLASKKLYKLGIKKENIITIDVGMSEKIGDIRIEGIYTIPNSPKVIDTAGYLIKFKNGRSFYHSGDTGISPLLLESVKKAEVGLFCINGKWGNMDAEQAAQVAAKVCTKIAIPHHYDLFTLNRENPEFFKYTLSYAAPKIKTKILKIMKPFIWQ